MGKTQATPVFVSLRCGHIHGHCIANQMDIKLEQMVSKRVFVSVISVMWWMIVIDASANAFAKVVVVVVSCFLFHDIFFFSHRISHCNNISLHLPLQPERECVVRFFALVGGVVNY
jgi:hypothetical protein